MSRTWLEKGPAGEEERRGGEGQIDEWGEAGEERDRREGSDHER